MTIPWYDSDITIVWQWQYHIMTVTLPWYDSDNTMIWQCYYLLVECIREKLVWLTFYRMLADYQPNLCHLLISGTTSNRTTWTQSSYWIRQGWLWVQRRANFTSHIRSDASFQAIIIIDSGLLHPEFLIMWPKKTSVLAHRDVKKSDVPLLIIALAVRVLSVQTKIFSVS